MIAVIIPAHNEQQYMAACLRSVHAAIRHPSLAGEAVQILVVLDHCTDRTGAIARGHGAQVTTVNARNVGLARSHGAKLMLERGARWLAFTDADSRVPGHWLARQLAFGADAVCGTVTVDQWAEHAPEVRSRYDAHYQPVEGHRHIHGANLGVCAIAYTHAGGFQHLPAHEDVRLVQDLERKGASIIWTATNSVITSARKDSRCREGFGDYLRSLDTAQPLISLSQPGQ
ncbi:glycosyltransferase [Pseudomonas abieticivorans]|uniref:glycosyltransferase n=1 Tax=Pseudomonas abieticivorans TaxID=2931382 RepID=UPI0020BD83BC|nr:glycosyltransferase [Pseudomonas sp. PIA16]